MWSILFSFAEYGLEIDCTYKSVFCAQVLSPKNLYAVNESVLGRKRYKRNSNTFDHILQVEKQELIISEYLINAQKNLKNQMHDIVLGAGTCFLMLPMSEWRN